MHVFASQMMLPVMAAAPAWPERTVGLLGALEQHGLIREGARISEATKLFERRLTFLRHIGREGESFWTSISRWHRELPIHAQHPHVNRLIEQRVSHMIRSDSVLSGEYFDRTLDILHISAKLLSGQPVSWTEAYKRVAPLEESLRWGDPHKTAAILGPAVPDLLLHLGLRQYAHQFWVKLQETIDQCNLEGWRLSSKVKPDTRRYGRHHEKMSGHLIVYAQALAHEAQARRLMASMIPIDAAPYRAKAPVEELVEDLSWDWEFERFRQVMSLARLLRDHRNSPVPDDINPYRSRTIQAIAKAALDANMGDVSVGLLRQLEGTVVQVDPALRAEVREAILAAQRRRLV